MSESAPLPCRCLCGAVRFAVTPLKPEMGVCHCGMCRRWTGGVFMAVECRVLGVQKGEALVTFASSDWAERGFCGVCGSSLFWRMSQGAPAGESEGGHLAVSYNSFEDAPSFAFNEEIFVDEKPAIYAFAGERPRKTGAEVIAEFGAGQAD